MNDRGLLASYLLSPLSKTTNPEHTSQSKPAKDLNSNRVDDLLINKTKPGNLCDNLLTFRDTDQKYEMERHLLKRIPNKNYNADKANLRHKKLMSEFAKEL